jgi:phospholipase C
MPTVDRRRFLQLTGGAAALSMLSTSVARAATIPASRQHGSIEDVEHIVVLMQENRSFDHYFGTLRGVRGFGDPHPAMLPSGKSVFHQADGSEEILPFRPNLDDLGLAFIEDLDHSWTGTHQAFDNGNWDAWIPAKSSTTMAHLQRQDIPFHYALADAFTICDDYHCSILSATDPNRYYMWTGWDGNDGLGGGPVIDNAELGYSWHTYPERLQAAGVSWKIYQDMGLGLDASGVWGWTEDAYIGNYGDNSLLYFDQYRTAQPGNPLYDNARVGTNANAGESFFGQLAADVKAGTLPQISWVVAPEAFTEHPNWPANYGAWYVSQVLDALTSNPEVWSKTAFLLTYDENDGFFDHIVPAYPNVGALPGASTVSTANEYYTGPDGAPGNYGLGVRVPMLVISPWSTGGWVCSQTFDHTSIIQFMERRFGVVEPNITPWRRAVAGDLTAAFDFGTARPAVAPLPSTAGYQPPDDDRHPSYVPIPPADPALPRQEPGIRPSRALGYQLTADAALSGSQLELTLRNRGTLGAGFQLRSTATGTTPATYTVEAGRACTASVPVSGAYDLSLHGPNGFFRRFSGNAAQPVAEVQARGDGAAALQVALTNTGHAVARLTVANVYTGPRHVELRPGESRTLSIATGGSGGWYDVTVTADGVAGFSRNLAGRLESGGPSISDPQLG